MKTFLILILMISLTGCYETENGAKIGNIVKISKEGLLIKTCEGQLIRGGISNGSGAFSPHPFDFTIEQPKLIEKAQQAMDKQQEVKIFYHRELFTMFRTETRGYFADDIEVLIK